MDFVEGYIGRTEDIRELFKATFTASEGAEEGAVIGDLVAGMMNEASCDDVLTYTAYDEGDLVGGIFFSRLVFDQDDRIVFILSPVAVRTGRQRTGVGQKLIAYGLEEMRRKGVDVVMTYGDPAYYSKSGFRQITEEFARSPHALSQPIGWQAQSLGDGGLQPLAGPSRCVEPLNKAELW